MNETNQSESMALDEKRQAVCLDAAIELEALALLLANMVPKEHNLTHLQVRGDAGRIKELSGVLMSCLNDDLASADSLEMVVSLKGYEEGLT